MAVQKAILMVEKTVVHLELKMGDCSDLLMVDLKVDSKGVLMVV